MTPSPRFLPMSFPPSMSPRGRARQPGVGRLAASLAAMSLGVALAAGAPSARAHGGLSDISALSALPLAVSVAAAPALLLSAGVVLVVVSVQALADGTVWVLQRVSDGARVVLKVVGKGLGASATAVGTTVSVTAAGAGLVLSAAGQVLAFVPNAVGQALLHNERVL